ncbi:MAG: hypothetical protein ACLQNG_13945 [Acidimicrobiales bacterium]|jgi:hypothetical protein
MNDDFDLANVLDDGTGPAASHDVLRQVVARHRRRRARQFHIVATTTIVVALAGAGAGLRLAQNGGTKSAAGTHPITSIGAKAPPGLSWDVASGVALGAQPAANNPTVEGASASPAAAAPGEFGFVAASPALQATGTFRPAALPVASSTNAGGGFGRGTKDCPGLCEPVYSVGASRLLFTRQVDGLSLTASLVSFRYPVVIHPTTPLSPASKGGTSGGAPTASSGSSGSGTVKVAKALPFVGLCPTSSELQVSVEVKGVTETLFVPAGGSSSQAFSVVASAAARFSSGESVVLAVARTSSSVSSVSAHFASGTSDAMAPKGGWAVLAEVVPASTDLARAGALTLTATSYSGRTLETAHLPAAGSLATAPVAPVCRYLVQPVNSVGTATPPPTTVTSPPATVQAGTTGGAAGSAAGSGSASTTMVVAPPAASTAP